MRSPTRQSGVALITVMLIVAIATLVAVSMVDRQQLDIRRTGNLVFSDQALEYALGAEAWAIGLLEQDARDNAVDYLGEDWATALAPIEVDVEEEALPSIDIDSGQPIDLDDERDALRIDGHHELDLAEPVREAISLAEPITLLCRPDCRGLCLTCGIDLNSVTEHSHTEDAVDPRLAALAGWREKADSN